MQFACMQKEFVKTLFEIKKVSEYHDLYVKGDTLHLADVFENFGRMYVNIYHLDSVKFLSALGLLDKQL